MAEKLYYADEKGRIFTGRDENNLFGARLFVDSTPDRSMGLWFWREEEVFARLEHDSQRFKAGVARMEAWLKSPEGYAKEPDMLRFFLRELWFPLFFQHRTEPHAVKLTWVQVKRLHEALTAELAKAPPEAFALPDPDKEAS